MTISTRAQKAVQVADDHDPSSRAVDDYLHVLDPEPSKPEIDWRDFGRRETVTRARRPTVAAQLRILRRSLMRAWDKWRMQTGRIGRSLAKAATRRNVEPEICKKKKKKKKGSKQSRRFRPSFTSTLRSGSSPDRTNGRGPTPGPETKAIGGARAKAGHCHGREKDQECRHGLKKATTPPPHTSTQSRLVAQPAPSWIPDLGDRFCRCQFQGVPSLWEACRK